MSSKPSATPRWANSGGTIVEPNDGKKDVGFVAGDRPPAEYLNWLFNLIYLWSKWLSDGDVSFNTVAVADTLTVTGETTLNDAITVNAALAATTVSAGQHYYSVAQHRAIPSLSWKHEGQDNSVDSQYNHQLSYFQNNDGGASYADLPFNDGETLTGISIRVQCTVAGISLSLWESDASSGSAAVETQIGSTTTLSSNANIQTASISGISQLMTGSVSKKYVLKMTGGSDFKIFNGRMDWFSEP